MDAWSSLSGIKRAKREADHPPALTAEVKNVWSYAAHRPYAFTARVVTTASYRINTQTVVS